MTGSFQCECKKRGQCSYQQHSAHICSSAQNLLSFIIIFTRGKTRANSVSTLLIKNQYGDTIPLNVIEAVAVKIYSKCLQLFWWH